MYTYKTHGVIVCLPKVSPKLELGDHDQNRSEEEYSDSGENTTLKIKKLRSRVVLATVSLSHRVKNRKYEPLTTSSKFSMKKDPSSFAPQQKNALKKEKFTQPRSRSPSPTYHKAIRPVDVTKSSRMSLPSSTSSSIVVSP